MQVYCQSVESAASIKPPSYFTLSVAAAKAEEEAALSAPKARAALLMHMPTLQSVIISNKLHSLRDCAVRLAKVVGCCHDNLASIHQCRICSVFEREEKLGRLVCTVCKMGTSGADEFLSQRFVSPGIESERALIAAYVVDHRAMVRDLVTWFNWHVQYDRDRAINAYFRDHYPVLAAAYEQVNSLPEFELDGRSVGDWAEAGFPTQEADGSSSAVPRYCSWPYLPEGDTGKRVFYISTILPLEEDFVTYLLRVMNPPSALVDQVTRQENEARQTPGGTASHRLTRRLEQVLRQSQPASAREAEDPRAERATRSEKMLSPGRSIVSPDGPRQLLGASLPRLVLISIDDRIVKLEPRPDYFFQADSHFINVFKVRIYSDAATSMKKAEDKW
jgi:hypothetical protein